MSSSVVTAPIETPNESAVMPRRPATCVMFTTRRGGFSRGRYESLNLGRLTADDPEAVARNRAILEAEFDVAMLSERAYAEFVPAAVTAFDAEQRVATLSNGAKFTFDVASLNAGSTVANGVPGAHEHAVPVKPFEDLVERLNRVGHIAIGGGGA